MVVPVILKEIYRIPITYPSTMLGCTIIEISKGGTGEENKSPCENTCLMENRYGHAQKV